MHAKRKLTQTPKQEGQPKGGTKKGKVAYWEQRGKNPTNKQENFGGRASAIKEMTDKPSRLQRNVEVGLSHEHQRSEKLK